MKTKFYAQAITVQSSLYLFALTSCQSYDPFDEESLFRSAYESNFVQQFGPIDPMQSWDFTSRGHAETRATDPYVSIVNASGWYEIPSSLIQNIKKLHTTTKAEEGFALQIGSEDCFEVFPVYRIPKKNGTNLSWELQRFIDGELVPYSSEKISWGMNDNIMIYKNKLYTYINNNDFLENSTRVKPIYTIDNRGQEEHLMYLNMHIIEGSLSDCYKNYAAEGSDQSSLYYQMSILPLTAPTNINGYQTMFIGCEAANFDRDTPSQDNVYGDRYVSLVLMLVGPHLPSIVPVKTDTEHNSWLATTGISKRYMIEDMGSTSDFDFNDIVVDVSNEDRLPVNVTQLWDNVKGLLTNVSLGSPSTQTSVTTATISYLCGTRPFELTVGNHTFGRVIDPTDPAQTPLLLLDESTEDINPADEEDKKIGWEPKVQAIITGWQPEQNNISVKVWRTDHEISQSGWSVAFPEMGKVPYIMAFDTKVPWADEGQKFTAWQQ